MTKKFLSKKLENTTKTIDKLLVINVRAFI